MRSMVERAATALRWKLSRTLDRLPAHLHSPSLVWPGSTRPPSRPISKTAGLVHALSSRCDSPRRSRLRCGWGDRDDIDGPEGRGIPPEGESKRGPGRSRRSSVPGSQKCRSRRVT